jgi:multiple sugar transport system ATP-binding protein
MASVVFSQASRIYPGTTKPAVDKLDLTVNDGEFLVLVGPSGCGKSTSLRMLAGLEEIDTGWCSSHMLSTHICQWLKTWALH